MYNVIFFIKFRNFHLFCELRKDEIYFMYDSEIILVKLFLGKNYEKEIMRNFIGRSKGLNRSEVILGKEILR